MTSSFFCSSPCTLTLVVTSGAGWPSMLPRSPKATVRAIALQASATSSSSALKSPLALGKRRRCSIRYCVRVKRRRVVIEGFREVAEFVGGWRRASGAGVLAELLHDGVVATVVVGRTKHGAASHQGVGPRSHDLCDVVHLHAAVHFEPDGLAAVGHVGVDALAGLHQFRQGARDELLPASASTPTWPTEARP